MCGFGRPCRFGEQQNFPMSRIETAEAAEIQGHAGHEFQMPGNLSRLIAPDV
jgi:hypothetical protein